MCVCVCVCVTVISIGNSTPQVASAITLIPMRRNVTGKFREQLALKDFEVSACVLVTAVAKPALFSITFARNPAPVRLGNSTPQLPTRPTSALRWNFCHFLQPLLGNPRRKQFLQVAISLLSPIIRQEELEVRVSGGGGAFQDVGQLCGAHHCDELAQVRPWLEAWAALAAHQCLDTRQSNLSGSFAF